MTFVRDDGSKILQAMGVDISRIKRADIHSVAGGVITIDVEMIAEIQNKEGLLTEIRKFHLVSNDEQS